jgi:spermidine/putrescine transport system permease protein
MTSRRALLLGPGLAWLTALLILPCALIFVLGFFERGVYGGIDYTFTTENFARAADPLYAGIFFYSARIALTAVLVSLLIGYPAAYCIAKSPKSRHIPLLILVMMPFWSNYLIRTYAWIVLLNREGLINSAFANLGFIAEPLPLLYNDFAIVTGLVYGYVPFMILALYSSISKLGPELNEASTDLGADGLRTFLRITLPLTLPGIAAGSVFVFVLSIGNFVTPDLLGGGKRTMLGNLIYDQFLTARDWPFGATLAFLLVALMMVLLTCQAIFVHRASGNEEARA